MPDPPWGDRPPRDAFEALRGFWWVGREAAERKKQVVQAVQASAHGETREQMRSMFEDEFVRREMSPDPVWVEQKLDELEWSPSERVRQTVERLWLAGGTLTRMARSHGIPEAPDWMRPPEDAGYRVWAPNREKTTVDIDPQATTWLDRVLVNAPGRVGDMLALVDVWFDWAADADEGGSVAVYLGPRRVGVLSRRATERFIPVMQSARQQNEKPCTSAQLAKAVHMQPPYLLVVEIPTGAGGSATR
jgi:hypothetical protein